MQIIEFVIAAVAVLSVLAFLVYMAGLLGMPTGKRPRTPTFDRLGEHIPATTNPGFEETEEEHRAP